MNIVVTCNECNNRFKPSNPYQLYCSEKCENVKKQLLKEKNESLFNRTCEQCGCGFRCVRENGKQKICDVCRRNNSRESLAKIPKKEVEKKPRHKVSYDELIRRSEYKRVYGKGAWDHYTKGRKWDKI